MATIPAALRYYSHREDASQPRDINRTWRTKAAHETGPYTVYVGEIYTRGNARRRGLRSYGVMVTIEGQPGVFYGVPWPTERSARDEANKVWREVKA